jgi:hypothetical protein
MGDNSCQKKKVSIENCITIQPGLILVAVAALYYFLEMQSNHFLQTASYMEPFTSSKVELILSAWKERNEAKFIMK